MREADEHRRRRGCWKQRGRSAPTCHDWSTTRPPPGWTVAIADEFADAADRSATARRLRALLDSQEDTAWFLTEVLQRRAAVPAALPPAPLPPAPNRRQRRPGRGPGPIEAARYTCPHGDYVWYRPDVGTPIPDCPTHHDRADPRT